MATPNKTVQSWETLYPGPPEGFELEPISAFYPLIAYMAAITIVLTLVVAWKKPLFDKFIIAYLIISAFIHFNLERYYAHYNHTILDPNNMDMMARIWRHYGTSDTRWWGQQPGIPKSQYSCMYGLEWLAAWECGPLVTLTIILAYFDSPWRWAVQSAAVTAQAYGLFITWLPAVYEDLGSVPVDDPILFWGYFIGWQFPWAIIPLMAVIQAGWETAKVFSRVRELEAQVAKKKKN